MHAFELKQYQGKLKHAALKNAMLLNNFCLLSFNFLLQFKRVESNVSPVAGTLPFGVATATNCKENQPNIN